MLIALSAQTVAAQNPTLKTRTKEDREREFQANHRITLNVQVTDDNGKPVTDLEARDFAIFDNHQPRKLATFHAIDGEALNDATEIVILLDAVNSTHADSRSRQGWDLQIPRAEPLCTALSDFICPVVQRQVEGDRSYAGSQCGRQGLRKHDQESAFQCVCAGRLVQSQRQQMAEVQALSAGPTTAPTKQMWRIASRSTSKTHLRYLMVSPRSNTASAGAPFLSGWEQDGRSCPMLNLFNCRPRLASPISTRS